MLTYYLSRTHGSFLAVRRVCRRKARSLVAELHANIALHPLGEQGGDHHRPHCIDQLLHQYSLHHNHTWVAGADLVSPQDDLHVGLFYQDRERYGSLVNLAPLRRPAAAAALSLHAHWAYVSGV